MKIRVLFFGATADAAGHRETDVELAPGASVGSTAELVLQEYPGLRNHRLLLALNEEYASPDHAVADGDELAIFTAVSGG